MAAPLASPPPQMIDTPPSDTTTLNGANRVDVQQAEAEFTQLRRVLSSSNSDDLVRAQPPTLQSEYLAHDLEKVSGDVATEERFDLREYLTSSNDASQAAGIKHKHVGVTWDDLEVIGIGGEDNKVSSPSCSGVRSLSLTFPIRSMSPHSWARSWGRSCSPSC